MNILEQIVASKRRELSPQKEAFPIKQLVQAEFFNRQCISLKSRFDKQDSWGIIAEFKRKSPSRGIISENHSVNDVTKGYSEAGAVALSVLTDYLYFGGRFDDLLCARLLNTCPILRKDFIIEEYQVYETKAMGADIILLIAACLTPTKSKKLAQTAHSLGLEVLLELHSEKDLDHLNEYIDFTGVNNRNLKDFSVDINTSVQLAKKIPDTICKISESGLNSAESIARLYFEGFQGFLLGEAFMSKDDPGAECRKLIQTIQQILIVK
jgi:indole-3-glycerol phosphate synthase